MVADPGAPSFASEGMSPRADREVDALLALAVTPGVTLDRFAGHFELGKGQGVEEGFSLARHIAYPPVDPDSVITQAVLALRPGFEDRVGVARFILASGNPAVCIGARALADRHGMMTAAPMHPEATWAGAGRTRYEARVEQAQVVATSHPHSDCLEELFVWQRYAD